VRPAKPLLASWKPYAELSVVEKQSQLLGLEAAMVSYIKKLCQASQQIGRNAEAAVYSSCLQHPQALLISPALYVSLVFPSFQKENKYHRHLVRCTKNWWGKGQRSDYVFF
jgi:hypothetical protein